MNCCSLEIVIIIIVVGFAFNESLDVEPPLDQQQRLQNGEKEFQRIRSHADHSKCWEDAITRLHDGCKHLTDIEQSRLAVAFANCHFEKSGLKTYPCSKNDSIVDCTKDMAKSVLAFNTYTEFYTHTSDICFYLQSHIWQQKTEDTINKLSSTSKLVAEQLEASLTNQKRVLEGQTSSLSNQRDILKNEVYLKNALKTSAESAKEAFLDMKKATAQQKAALTETFDSLFKGVDRITKLQSMLLGEFMTLHSLGFYLAAILACYLITSSPRTAGARLWLFAVLSAHIIIERVIVRWCITDKESQQSGTTTEIIHGHLWLLRKIFVFESFLILLYFATKYCDYGRVNYNMLRDIQIELKKLKSKGMDIGKSLTDGSNKSLLPLPSEETFSYSDYSVHKYPAIHPIANLDETCLSEEDLYTDDSSDSYEDDSGSESEDPTFVLSTSQRDDKFINYQCKPAKASL
ncbi:uncharacterized protein LOC114524977 [Dendronephthya gigantea]|uniref:uncharacterized protein LOC114524977 n=1 Tax=Dendronephthya gigantea TaxID=151771 RepID=UPI00106B2229|nr:uncharacterized protein LOC114524977 [Dendronephthya gigantea]